MNTIKYKVGDKVFCINGKPLSNTGFGPDLTEGQTYQVKYIHEEYSEDQDKTFQHLCVGMETKFEVIRSFDTGAKLPMLGRAWCHPSRFKLASI